MPYNTQTHITCTEYTNHTDTTHMSHHTYRYMLHTYGGHNHTDTAQIITILTQTCAPHPPKHMHHTDTTHGCLSHTHTVYTDSICATLTQPTGVTQTHPIHTQSTHIPPQYSPQT